MTSLHCPIVLSKMTSVSQQQRQRSDAMKSKMAARGKFKSQNLCRLLLLINVTFLPSSSKICNLGIIWNNLASTRVNSRGSLQGFLYLVFRRLKRAKKQEGVCPFTNIIKDQTARARSLAIKWASLLDINFDDPFLLQNFINKTPKGDSVGCLG